MRQTHDPSKLRCSRHIPVRYLRAQATRPDRRRHSSTAGQATGSRDQNSIWPFIGVRIFARQFPAYPRLCLDFITCLPTFPLLPGRNSYKDSLESIPLESKPLVIVLEPGGRNAWHEAGLYNRMAAEGCVVCAPDLRGIGDMTPEFSRGAARHAGPHNSEEEYAWSSLILGKPLAGQRVTDILSVVRGLRTRPEFARRPVVVAARGVLSVPAQFAAALEPAIGTLYLAEGLISFRSIVETEVYKYPFGNFVPNLLAHTDLPELTVSLAPRRVTLAGAIDGAGNRMSVEEVRAEFPSASNVRILPEPAWSPSDILSA